MTSPGTGPVGHRFLAVALLALCALVVPASALSADTDAPAGADSQHQAADRFRDAAAYSKGHKGSAVVVMSGGKILYEVYDGKGGADQPQRLASGTKSFWGVLAMAAVEDGLFTLDEPVAETLTEWRGDPNKSRILVRHLLDFTSGLEPATALLRGRPKFDDKFKRVLGVPGVDVPGGSFAYGPSHLAAFGVFLQRKLRAAGRPDDPVAYLKQRVLEPIGMRIGRWTRDAAGNPVMFAGAFVAPREWIKLGALLNQGGRWGDRQIIERSLLMQVFQGSVANPSYGLTLWLNREYRGGQGHAVADGNAARRSANSDDGLISRTAPRDLAMAAGSGKQRLYIIPSLDLVIVRQGESKGSGWSDAAFLARALSSQAPARAPALKALPMRLPCTAIGVRPVLRRSGSSAPSRRAGNGAWCAVCASTRASSLSACISAARAARGRAD